MKQLSLFFILFLSCQPGKLIVIADLPVSLKEISAAEMVIDSDIIWTIEDAGNKNHLYGLDSKGSIIKDVTINNAQNKDWEELTSDAFGNIYIGDFGNNSKNRKLFTIYKVLNIDRQHTEAQAERIDFILPKKIESKDFEAFFLMNNYFYIFSKGNKKEVLIKVPNRAGKHTAIFIDTFNLKGKNNKITSADISADGKTVILLNHERLWKLTDFKSDNFFSGIQQKLSFEHNSQKEGVCFIDKETVFITDERTKKHGGNLYSFKLE